MRARVKRAQYIAKVLAPTPLHIGRTNQAVNEVHKDTALTRQFNKRKSIRLSCPQCRKKNIQNVICCRRQLREHLLEHRIIEAMGFNEAELFAQRNHRHWYPPCGVCVSTGRCWRDNLAGAASNLEIDSLGIVG